MTSRERVQTVLSGGIPDRVPIHDAYWGTTLERWYREGLPRDIPPAEFFGSDIVPIGGFDDTLQLPVRVSEQTERHRVVVDGNGATRMEMSSGDGWTPPWLDFTIKGCADWQRLRSRADFDPSRISAGNVDGFREARRQGKFVLYMIHACFHPTWQKVGMENLFVWFHEEPELVDEMFSAHMQLVIDLYDASKAQGIEFDAAFMADDLATRTRRRSLPRCTTTL